MTGKGKGKGRGAEPELYELMTAAEAATYLRVSRTTLDRIVSEGGVRPFRTPGGHRRFSLRELNDYLYQTRRFND